MTIATGTGRFDDGFQGLLHEEVVVLNKPFVIPHVKVSPDSVVFINQLNELIPSAYDYVDLSYTGDNLTLAVFKQGGSGGTTIATLTITYDVNNNIKTVTRT